MVENILRDESRRDDTLLNEFRVNYTRKDSDGKKQQDSFRIWLTVLYRKLEIITIWKKEARKTS